MGAPGGSALRSAVASLGVPFGLERSCKMQPGVISQDRMLMSVHRESLGPDPLARILDVLSVAPKPANLTAQLQDALEDADVIHFGYDAQSDGDIFKLYCEYASRMRAALQSGGATPVIVHRAWKWPAHAFGDVKSTLYVWTPPRPGVSMVDRVAARCGERGVSHPAARAVAALVARAGLKVDTAMLLDVDEVDAARRSFDLNLYPADLTMRDVRDMVAQLGRDLLLDPKQVSAVFDPVAHLSLGHLSGGDDGRGIPFATLYFGVEAC